jgi:hypothetical protein
MFTCERDVARSAVHLDKFHRPAADKTPQQRRAENRATPRREDRFTTADRDGRDDRSRAKKAQQWKQFAAAQ